MQFGQTSGIVWAFPVKATDGHFRTTIETSYDPRRSVQDLGKDETEEGEHEEERGDDEPERPERVAHVAQRGDRLRAPVRGNERGAVDGRADLRLRLRDDLVDARDVGAVLHGER